jgi:hypothetical protein
MGVFLFVDEWWLQRCSDMTCEGIRRDNSGRTVHLPGHFFVDRCQTLREAMAACKTQRDFLHELFTVCQHLTRQLVIMHRRKLVLRDICLRNVVRTNLGQVRSWTFLEYASAVRSGTRTDSMAVRTTPPSVRPFQKLAPHSINLCCSLLLM